MTTTTMLRRPCTVVLAVSVLLAGPGCSDGPTEPDTSRPASVLLSVLRDTLRFVGDTVRLTASARTAAGAPVSGIPFIWTSTDSVIASVSADGLVTARANGAAIIKASTGALSAEQAITVRQAGQALALVSGADQAGTVGAPLDSQVTFTVRDGGGSVAKGVSVTFLADGGGAPAPAIAISDDSGTVRTTWTLGTTAGLQSLSAAVTDVPAVTLAATATAFADLPDSMFALAGDAQSEFPSHTLPQPIVVRVVDRFGNGVPDVPITFSLSGDGALDTTEVSTDLDGVAAAHWTLGAALGAQSARAVLLDSAVADVVALRGSPVDFQANAVALTLDAVGDVVVGETLTVAGVGFGSDPAANVVTLGGIAVPLLSSSPTALSFVVPSFGCVPTAERVVSVTRESQTATAPVQVAPAGLLALAVGEAATRQDAGDLCLQLPSSSGGTDEYLVGVTAARGVNAVLPAVLTGYDGVLAPPSVVAASSMLVGGPPVAHFTDAGDGSEPRTGEERLRSWESRFFATRATRGPRGAVASPRAFSEPNAVGDQLALRVPDITADACNDYTAVLANVVAVGPNVIVATDATLPSDPASLLALTAALNSFVAQFGAQLYAVATSYLGTPSDIDQNQGIIVLLSPAVNALGVPGFTTAIDLLDRNTCPSSDAGEIVYLAVPAAPSAATVAALLVDAGPRIAHELAHLIQASRRVALGGAPLPSWLGEGLAALGSELTGLAVRGDTSGMDYGAATVGADAEALRWYRPHFDRLSRLFGWDGASGSIPGAPERCSLFGFGGIGTPCTPGFAEGAGWSFLRFVVDRLDAAYPGGRAGFLRDLIDASPTGDATAALASLANLDLDALVVAWAQSLYADGRVASAEAPSLQFRSWDLASVFGALPSAQRLTPQARTFGTFVRDLQVVGGGTAYTTVGAGGAHGPLALRLRDAVDAALGTEMRPRLWVVRIR